MRSLSYAAAVVVATSVTISGCATKKFVRTEVGDVNAKVGSLTTALEGTQARTQQNEKGIAAADAKAEAAGRSATEARTAADGAATATKEVDTRLSGLVAGVAAGVEQAAQASRKLVYEVTLSEGQDQFKSSTAIVPDEVKQRLDKMFNDAKADTKAVFFEIEGHTDNRGETLYNGQLGLERAEAVMRYLHDQHQVPLHKMNVISYGETKPVAPNTTRAGRAQNRRVVVRLMS